MNSVPLRSFDGWGGGAVLPRVCACMFDRVCVCACSGLRSDDLFANKLEEVREVLCAGLPGGQCGNLSEATATTLPEGSNWDDRARLSAALKMRGSGSRCSTRLLESVVMPPDGHPPVPFPPIFIAKAKF